MKWPNVRTILAVTVAAGVSFYGVIGVIAAVQGRTLGDSISVTADLLAVIIGGLIGAAALSGKDDEEDEP